MKYRRSSLSSSNHHAASWLYSGVVLLVWLVPFFWSGWKGQTWSWFPRALSFQHTAAGLFTQRSTRWWDQHLEGQDVKGEWHELAEQEVFPMGAFGYRSRYDRILIETGRSRGVQQIRQRLAEHVVQRLGEIEAVGVKAKNPSPSDLASTTKPKTHLATPPRGEGPEPQAPSPPRGEGWGEEWNSAGESIRELRLVRSYWSVGDPGMANPTGRWSPPPITAITGDDRSVLGTYKIVDGKVLEVARERTPVLAKTATPKPTVSLPPKPADMITRRQVQGSLGRGPVMLSPGARVFKPAAGHSGEAPVTMTRPAASPRPGQATPFSGLKLGKPGVPVVKNPAGVPPRPAFSTASPGPLKPTAPSAPAPVVPFRRVNAPAVTPSAPATGTPVKPK